MVKVTSAAADQIKKQIQENNADHMYLRIAAKKVNNGAIEYGMGFDEKLDDDLLVNSEDVRLIISPASQAFLQDVVLDYVELEPGNHNFIFSNPNDPRHTPVSS